MMLLTFFHWLFVLLNGFFLLVAPPTNVTMKFHHKRKLILQVQSTTCSCSNCICCSFCLRFCKSRSRFCCLAKKLKNHRTVYSKPAPKRKEPNWMHNPHTCSSRCLFTVSRRYWFCCTASSVACARAASVKKEQFQV